jgi:hypothetical protein
LWATACATCSIHGGAKSPTSWDEERGIPHRLYEPEAFISIPLAAHVRVGEGTYRAKTPAMSVSPDGQEITAELVYMPSHRGETTGDVFSTGVDLAETDVRGKIVLTEGMASPGKVTDVMAAGALAGIFINPGEAIHEGICTTIWGTPDLATPGTARGGRRARRGRAVGIGVACRSLTRPRPVGIRELGDRVYRLYLRWFGGHRGGGTDRGRGARGPRPRPSLSRRVFASLAIAPL